VIDVGAVAQVPRDTPQSVMLHFELASAMPTTYAEGLFCSFEQFRIADALTAAEQPCRSGRSLEFRYEYRTLGEPLSQEFCREAVGIGTAGLANPI
jgi:hypothetical protein